MPTYEIQGPGGKTYEIDGPPGATREQIISRIQGALSAQQGQRPTGPQPSAAAQQEGGSLDSIVRSMANAATFNLADPIAAAADATIPLDSGSSHASSWRERYRENLANQKARTRANEIAHPSLSLAGGVAGGMMNPVSRAVGLPKSLFGAATQGAALGGAYGAGASIGSGGKNDALVAALKQASFGAATGGILGSGVYGASKAITPAAKTAAAAVLEKMGVSPTIGQSLGGTAQRLEDSATSIPLVGDAIRDRQIGALNQFNRATYNRVLEPLGLSYSKDAPVGNAAVSHIDDIIGSAYERAYRGAVVRATPAFTAAIKDATDEAANVLPQQRVQAIRNNINRLVISKLDGKGQLSGDALQTAKNWLAEQARGSANSSMDDRATAVAYGKVLDGIKSGIRETDPDRGALLKAADTSFMRFTRLVQAAGTTNANAKGGVVTPAHLATALRSLDTSTRRKAFAMGAAPMQDLAQAGQQALSQTVPDSGTALRSVFEHPLSAALTSPVWLAGRALYSNKGQALAKALLFGAPDARKATAALPLYALPGAVGLAASQGGTP
jgi:hypothetical protein